MNINKFNEILISSHIEPFNEKSLSGMTVEVQSAELTIVRVTFDEPYYEMRTYFVRNGLVDEEEIEFEN